jgi:hypothetical protein
MKDAKLWAKLDAYDFPLTGKGKLLARKVAWETTLNAAKSTVAVAEYRCYLYLAAVSDEPLAPSQVVDAVWQCHVKDTSAYVDGLCMGVIGRMIHNTPGRRAPMLDAAYTHTLALYRQEFGVQPPPKVWPDAAALGWGRAVGGFGVAGVVLGGLGWSVNSMLTVGIGIAMVLGACAWWATMSPWFAGKREAGTSDGGAGGDAISGGRRDDRDNDSDSGGGDGGGGD